MGTRFVLDQDGSVKTMKIGSMTDNYYLASVHGVTSTTPFIVPKNDPMEMALSQLPARDMKL